MREYELSIRETYVPDWGLWECIREIVQNGLDSQDCGNPLTIHHDGTWLNVFNEGAKISPKDLVLGEGDKRFNQKLRGKYGEGLALAFLAGYRSETEIKIFVGKELWEPVVHLSDTFDVRLLFIRVQDSGESVPGVRVCLKITNSVWEEYKARFLSLRDLDEEHIINVDEGSVLLDRESRGLLYCKGIFVEKRPEFKYGYNLLYVDLDRDRGLFPDFDLKYEIGRMYSNAAKKEPERISRIVYPLLKNQKPDVECFSSYNTSEALKEGVASEFFSENGQEAVAVSSIGESNEAEHLGRKGVVVPKVLGNVLSSKIDSVFKIKNKDRREVLRTYARNELSYTEKLCLDNAADIVYGFFKRISGDPKLCRAIGIPPEWSTVETFDEAAELDPEQFKNNKILNNIRIVDFKDPTLLGTTKNPDGEIQIARHRLENIIKFLRVLVHEKCHAWSVSTDGTVSQTHMVEEFWSALFFVHTLGDDLETC